MTLHPIKNLRDYLSGARRLPAGAVPLAQDGSSPDAPVICLMPTGAWVSWSPSVGVLKLLPPDTQKTVMAIIASQLGMSSEIGQSVGTAKATVANWRQARAPLPIGKAHALAQALVDSCA